MPQVQGGVTYTLAATIFRDAHAARHDMQGLTAGRTRPIHWHKEGPTIREAALSLIEHHVIAGTALAQRTSRFGQVTARSLLMAELVVDLASYGVNHMIIESRGQLEDGRDRSVILDCLHELAISNLAYDWRTKAEPLLSYPDALAGITREQLTLGHSPGFSRLQKASIVSEVRYLA
ncbi:MAG: hypothetical protein OXG41_14535 [Acidimicrobiaceae bacterium]|nr:hypothetical protein [Acidimicrobiaceae bacterium]